MERARRRRATPARRRATIVLVSWAMLVPAVYFALASGASVWTQAGAAVAMAVLALTNVVLSRVDIATAVSGSFDAAVGGAQVLSLVSVWFCSDQSGFGMLTGAIATLAMAFAGLTLGEVAATAAAMAAAYLVMV